MIQFRLVWISAIVATSVLLSNCTGCHRDAWIPEAGPDKGPSKIDLVEFQRQRALALDSLMATVTSDWEGPIQTGTGLWLQVLDSVPGSPAVRALPEGSVLEIHHRFSLLDGRVLTDWEADGPLAFELGSTDIPSGFHELFGQACLGDSLQAVLPPILAWGMSGMPPHIPQEAVIAVECRVHLYRRPA